MAGALTGQVVIVFGGSSGIGLGTAKVAQAEGASVMIIGRDVEKLRAASATIAGSDWRSTDVMDVDGIARSVTHLSAVDHVFLSVGQGGASNVLTNAAEDLRRPFEERVFGTFNVVRAVAPKMREGSITLMSGMYASRIRPHASAQTAALCAVESLARTLALDLAPIRVNAVAPGWIDTPRLDQSFGAEKATRIEAIARHLPGKRIGNTNEVATAVLLLMTNRYINGEVLHIDGGGRTASAPDGN
jgi:NAD(P)-dependent dehydrogenase (short-subunit alcohol dehydrogenase family)